MWDICSKITSFSIEENKSVVCCWSGSGSFSTLQIAWRSWRGEIFFSIFVSLTVLLVIICMAWSSDTKNTAKTTLFSHNCNSFWFKNHGLTVTYEWWNLQRIFRCSFLVFSSPSSPLYGQNSSFNSLLNSCFAFSGSSVKTHHG